MSTETLEWLRNNIRVGFTEKRGTAWWSARGAEGNHYPGPVPMDEVVKLMSYPVGEGRVSVTVIVDGEEVTFTDPNRKAIVRLDTLDCFNVPTNSYRIHWQKEWCVDSLELLSGGGLEVGSCGLLKGGRQAFVQAELADTREAAEGVKHRPFLSSVTSHDGSLSTTFLRGTTVIVCDNTLRAGLAEYESLKTKIRHSSLSLTRLEHHREKLGLLVEEAGDDFDREVKELTSKYVSDEQWNEFVKRFSNPTGQELKGRSLTMAETKARDLNHLWNYDERVAPWKNNAFGTVMAVNTFTHHMQNVKGMERAERNASRMVTGEFEKLDSSTLALLNRVS